MNCQICGRRSAPGAKLCADCRAARKRAFDATITQPLMAMAGAGTVSRTLARLRRAEASPEAKARRAARKAKAAAESATSPLAVPAAAARKSATSRSLLWILLSIGVVLAAIAGWHRPNHAPAPDTDPDSLATPAMPLQAGAVTGSPGPKPAETLPPAAALPPLPTIVERELVPYAPPAGRPATPKRPAAAKVAPPPEPTAEVEMVRVPTPAPAPPVPQPAPRVDPWQQMKEAIGRCPDDFLGRVVCEQRVRLQYCEGQWGKVPQCPGGPSAHD